MDKTSDKYKSLSWQLDTKAHLFLNRVLNKIHDKADEGRSMEPWKDHNTLFLLDRLREEFDELSQHFLVGAENKVVAWEDDNGELQDELIDVAAFCIFLFWNLEESKRK